MYCWCTLLRCFFIAQSYVLVKKWSEALVLYERVLKYAKEVQSKAKNLNNSLKVGPLKTQTGNIRKRDHTVNLYLPYNSICKCNTKETHAKCFCKQYSFGEPHLYVWFLQDLPDVQELIAEVNAEKYSLQAAAILGESTFSTVFSFIIFILFSPVLLCFFSCCVYNLQGMFVFQTPMRPLKFPLSSRWKTTG